MKHRWIPMTVLAILLPLLLTLSAAAAGKGREPAAVFHRQREQGAQAVLQEDTRPINPDVLTEWPEDGERYLDLLQGITRDAYLYIEEVLQEETFCLFTGDCNGDGQDEEYWAVEDVFHLDYGDDFESWYSQNAIRIDWALWDAINALMLDRPEFFWVRADYYWYYYPDYYEQGSVAIDVYFTAMPETDTIGPDPNYQWDLGYRGYRSRIDQILYAVMQEAKPKSTVEKLAFFDEWLSKLNEYDAQAAKDGLEHPVQSPWNIIGSLVDHDAVCEGYAKGFQLFCHKAKIPCLQVYSDTHMWNLVKVDGTWYVVDPTWNDPAINEFGVTDYFSTRDYFLCAPPTVEQDGSYDHVIHMDLPTPKVSETGYFSRGWHCTDGTIHGGEVGTGTCLMAFYAENGQMLQCLPCRSFLWTEHTTMFMAPDVDPDLLKCSCYAVRYMMDQTHDPTAERTRIELRPQAAETASDRASVFPQ